MKIIKIMLSIVGVIFLIPILFVMWIAVLTGIILAKYLDDIGVLPAIGIFALGIFLQLGWIIGLAKLSSELLGK